MAKIKSRVSLLRAVQRTSEHQPSNVDRERSAKNQNESRSVSDVMNRYSVMLPGKVRKNAVHAVELMMTASPDFRGNWEHYLASCDQWAKNLFSEKNVLSITHHHDETTPHSHILVMPLKDGRLNAAHFIGGSRDRMAELQTDFFENVGKEFGLARGQSRAETRAWHTPPSLHKKVVELKQFKNRLNKTSEELAKTIFEFMDKQTPEDLRLIAEFMETNGFKTFDEYLNNRKTYAGI